MTETVVHVTTLEQWKSVLDVWFEQGYLWVDGDDIYNEHYFRRYGSRQIGLKDSTKKYICCWVNNDYDGYNMIEFSEFMAQQKEDNEMKTYYVTQEQLDFLNTIYEKIYSLDELLHSHTEARNLFGDFSIPEGNAVLRYLGGDTSIEFKVKERLYQLWRNDEDGDRVYMRINSLGTPDWTTIQKDAFTATLAEIKKHKTISWEIEEVK